MFTWILRAVFVLLSAVLLVWVGEGLFGVDQSVSMLPFLAGDTTGGAVITLGVFWGLSLLGASLAGGGTGIFSSAKVVAQADAGRLTAIGVGTVTDIRRTGVTINDVPQYEVALNVSPPEGSPFDAQLRMLLDPVEEAGVGAGSPLPVRFDPNRRDRVALADPTERPVRDALLQWRIHHGLVDPRFQAARQHGVSAPASVLSLRPTGRRSQGQVELELRLLVTPEDGRPSWEADTVTFVYPDALSRVQVGSPVFAMYQPHDPQTVAMTIERED